MATLKFTRLSHPVLGYPDGVWIVLKADEGEEISEKVAEFYSKEDARDYVRGVDASPDYWRCKTCGCLWRDNHDKGVHPGTAIEDGSVSLSSEKQKSCPDCEMRPSAVACEPLYLGRRFSTPAVIHKCRCGFTVDDAGAKQLAKGVHYNAVHQPSPNGGIAYCPICDDETLVQHNAEVGHA